MTTPVPESDTAHACGTCDVCVPHTCAAEETLRVIFDTSDGAELARVNVPVRCLSGALSFVWQLETTLGCDMDNIMNVMKLVVAKSNAHKHNASAALSKCPHAAKCPHMMLVRHNAAVRLVGEFMKIMPPQDWEQYMQLVVERDRVDVLALVMRLAHDDALPGLRAALKRMETAYETWHLLHCNWVLAWALLSRATKCLAHIFGLYPPDNTKTSERALSWLGLSPTDVQGILGIRAPDVAALLLSGCDFDDHDAVVDLVCNGAPKAMLCRYAECDNQGVPRPSSFGATVRLGNYRAASRMATVALAAWPAAEASTAIACVMDGMLADTATDEQVRRSADIILASAPCAMLALLMQILARTPATERNSQSFHSGAILVYATTARLGEVLRHLAALGDQQDVMDFVIRTRRACVQLAAPLDAPNVQVPAAAAAPAKPRAPKVPRAKPRNSVSANGATGAREQVQHGLWGQHPPPTRVRPESDKPKTDGLVTFYSPWPRDEQKHWDQQDVTLD